MSVFICFYYPVPLFEEDIRDLLECDEVSLLPLYTTFLPLGISRLFGQDSAEQTLL